MKELSIEEKAKRYDDAIKKAGERYNKEYTSTLERSTLSYVFPELAESDDERIRKALTKLVKKAGEGYENVIDGVSIENAISWLEKQGEHANFRNKIQIGDKVTRNEDGILVNLSQLNRVAKKDEKQGEQKPVPNWMPKFLDELRSKKNYFDCDEHKDIEGGILAIINWMNPNYFKEKDGKQKPADKVEPRFKKDDWVIVSTTKGDKVVQIASVEYSKDGHPSYTTTEGRWFGDGTKARLLTDKDVETITLPESKVFVNQKPAAWSEEDESKIKGIINTLEGLYDNAASDTTKDLYRAKIDWLKSLRPQNKWRPSEEQMQALEYFIINHNEHTGYAKDLEELRQNLKKLKD